MRAAQPRACLERFGVLNDKERSGVQPDERSKGNKSNNERDLRSPRDGFVRRLAGWRERHRDSQYTERTRESCLHLRRRGEDDRHIADEVSNTGAKSDTEDSPPLPCPDAQMRDQGDGGDTQSCADQKGVDHCPCDGQGREGQQCGCRGECESCTKTTDWIGKNAHPWRQQAKQNAPSSHSCHDDLERIRGNSKFSQPGKECKLREDEEVDIHHGNERNAAPARCRCATAHVAATFFVARCPAPRRMRRRRAPRESTRVRRRRSGFLATDRPQPRHAKSR